MIRRRIPGQRGYESHPTDACEELAPVLEVIGTWGPRWVESWLKPSTFAGMPPAHRIVAAS